MRPNACAPDAADTLMQVTYDLCGFVHTSPGLCNLQAPLHLATKFKNDWDYLGSLELTDYIFVLHALLPKGRLLLGLTHTVTLASS